VLEGGIAGRIERDKEHLANIFYSSKTRKFNKKSKALYLMYTDIDYLYQELDN
jgi:hypothetical protein